MTTRKQRKKVEERRELLKDRRKLAPLIPGSFFSDAQINIDELPMLRAGFYSKSLSYKIYGKFGGEKQLKIDIKGYPPLWAIVATYEEGQAIAFRLHNNGHKNVLGEPVLKPHQWTVPLYTASLGHPF